MRGYRGIKIRCVETGQEWPSKLKCAADIGISPSQLYEHMRFGEKVKGRTYIKVV